VESALPWKTAAAFSVSLLGLIFSFLFLYQTALPQVVATPSGGTSEGVEYSALVFASIGIPLYLAVTSQFAIASTYFFLRAVHFDKRWVALLKSYEESGVDVDGTLNETDAQDSKSKFWISYKISSTERAVKYIRVPEETERHDLRQGETIALVRLADHGLSAMCRSQLQEQNKELRRPYRREMQLAASLYLLLLYSLTVMQYTVVLFPTIAVLVYVCMLKNHRHDLDSLMHSGRYERAGFDVAKQKENSKEIVLVEAVQMV